VIHELAHNTLYVKPTPFNESSRASSDIAARRRSSARGANTLDAGAPARGGATSARSTCLRGAGAPSRFGVCGPLNGARLEQVRSNLFGWARDQFRGPVGQSLETYDWRWFAQARSTMR